MICTSTMASRPRPNETFSGAVEAAVQGLVRTRHWGQTAYVSLPLIFPGGSMATLRVTPAAGGFRIDDGGFAYRELEAIGSERSFARTAAKIAEREDLDVNRRVIYVTVDEEGLSRALCDVAMASHAVAEQVYRKLAEHEEEEIEDYLQERLSAIFGQGSLHASHTIKGFSTIDWDVSAVLSVNSHTAVFQAVGGHANSIYRTRAAFGDLAELPSPPRLVAVVKDKEALGPKLTLLSQTGRVIESTQADDVYLRAAA